MNWLREKTLSFLKLVWRKKYNQIMIDRAVEAHEEDDEYRHPEGELEELNLDLEVLAEQINKDLQKQMEKK